VSGVVVLVVGVVVVVVVEDPGAGVARLATVAPVVADPVVADEVE